MSRAPLSERPDADLLDLIAAESSRDAMRVLYDRHVSWLSARLKNRCADDGVVHDALQDTFVAVWRSAGRYDGTGEVPAWLWGIAIRRLIGQLRRQPRLLDLRHEPDAEVSAEERVLAGVDPAYDVAAAAPLSGLRLVLVRTVAVEVVAVAICLVGALGHLDHGPVAIAWLLPGLALAATTLALSTWTQPWTSAGLVVGTWLTGVALAGRLGEDWLAPFGPPTQAAAVAVIALAGALTIVRSPRLDHREL
jgi:RNA polymerase sigma-70 factor, ECF subfamily